MRGSCGPCGRKDALSGCGGSRTRSLRAKAERAELRRRLELFERIAAAAGASLDDPAQNDAAAADTSAPVPPSVLAAAQDPRRSGAPVRFDVDGSEFIAVVDSEGGEPHEWWSAIRRLASRLRSAS